MDKTIKNSEDLKMEAASEIGIDIKKKFDESDENGNTAFAGGRMVQKMIERKSTEQ